jgi:hypothetical protein
MSGDLSITAGGAPETRWGGSASAGPVRAGSPPSQPRKKICTCVPGLAVTTLSASPTLGSQRPRRAAFASGNPMSVPVLALSLLGRKSTIERGGGFPPDQRASAPQAGSVIDRRQR